MTAQAPRPRVGGSTCSQCGKAVPSMMLEGGKCPICRAAGGAATAAAAAADPTQTAIMRLEAGDILLLRGACDVSKLQGAAKVVQRILILPSLIQGATGGTAGFRGQAEINHALIVSSKVVVAATATVQQHADVMIAHSTGGGTVAEDFFGYLGKVSDMGIEVFRLKNQAALAAAAGTVGATWARGNDPKRSITYSKLKAFLAALSSSSYGPFAKIRSKEYREAKNTAGGPRSFNDPDAKKHMFCSMFVIACYQAALTEQQTVQYMALDARHTTPMYLYGWLKAHSAWEHVFNFAPTKKPS